MGRRGVEVVVILLDVLAVVPLGTGQAEQPLLEDRVAPVPEGGGEDDELVAVAKPGDGVLAPAVRLAPRLVVRQKGPGFAISAVVFADGRPGPVADVRPPPPPAGRAVVDLGQALVFGGGGHRRWLPVERVIRSAASRQKRTQRAIQGGPNRHPLHHSKLQTVRRTRFAFLVGLWFRSGAVSLTKRSQATALHNPWPKRTQSPQRLIRSSGRSQQPDQTKPSYRAAQPLAKRTQSPRRLIGSSGRARGKRRGFSFPLPSQTKPTADRSHGGTKRTHHPEAAGIQPDGLARTRVRLLKHRFLAGRLVAFFGKRGRYQVGPVPAVPGVIGRALQRGLGVEGDADVEVLHPVEVTPLRPEAAEEGVVLDQGGEDLGGDPARDVDAGRRRTP